VHPCFVEPALRVQHGLRVLVIDGQQRMGASARAVDLSDGAAPSVKNRAGLWCVILGWARDRKAIWPIICGLG
jgi:hypothetical protein